MTYEETGNRTGIFKMGECPATLAKLKNESDEN